MCTYTCSACIKSLYLCKCTTHTHTHTAIVNRHTTKLRTYFFVPTTAYSAQTYTHTVHTENR